jgi:hypothetical protein
MIMCIQEVCAAAAAKPTVKYYVYKNRDGDSPGTVQESDMVCTIPDLLSVLRSHNLPSCAISRDCLPYEIETYQASWDAGEWKHKPLLDADDEYWSFTCILAEIDDIARAQALTADMWRRTPPPTTVGWSRTPPTARRDSTPAKPTQTSGAWPRNLK